MKGFTKLGILPEDKRCLQDMVDFINRPYLAWVNHTQKSFLWVIYSDKFEFKDEQFKKYKSISAPNFPDIRTVYNTRYSDSIIEINYLYSAIYGNQTAYLTADLVEVLSQLLKDFRSPDKPLWGIIGDYDMSRTK